MLCLFAAQIVSFVPKSNPFSTILDLLDCISYNRMTPRIGPLCHHPPPTIDPLKLAGLKFSHKIIRQKTPELLAMKINNNIPLIHHDTRQSGEFRLSPQPRHIRKNVVTKANYRANSFKKIFA